MASSSAISHDEFQRMQTQLLDLRTANYSLMEEGNRFRIGRTFNFSRNSVDMFTESIFFLLEIRNTTTKYQSTVKELHKALQILEKSRKAKDVEMLFAENEALQRKILSQEEEFRMQNQTLLQELTLVSLFDIHYYCHLVSVNVGCTLTVGWCKSAVEKRG